MYVSCIFSRFFQGNHLWHERLLIIFYHKQNEWSVRLVITSFIIPKFKLNLCSRQVLCRLPWHLYTFGRLNPFYHNPILEFFIFCIQLHFFAYFFASICEFLMFIMSLALSIIFKSLQLIVIQHLLVIKAGFVLACKFLL